MSFALQYRSPRPQTLARAVALAHLIETSDVVLLTLPLDRDSNHIIDADSLRRMRSTALLVNISPDDVTDPVAVREALLAGEIGGAALDLLRPEPFVDLPGTVITPRRAWHTNECFLRRIAQWKDTLARYLAGERQQNLNDGDFVRVPQQ